MSLLTLGIVLLFRSEMATGCVVRGPVPLSVVSSCTASATSDVDVALRLTEGGDTVAIFARDDAPSLDPNTMEGRRKESHCPYYLKGQLITQQYVH